MLLPKFSSKFKKIGQFFFQLGRQPGWLVIFAILLISRLYLIDQIPTALHQDEMIYAVMAKSWLLTGSDLLHHWQPWRIEPFDEMFAELPAIVMAMGSLLTTNSVLGAKLVSVFFSLTLPFILAWLGWGLCHEKKVAQSILIVAIINPWLWQLGRMSFDGFYSLWFYSLASAIFLNFVGYKKLVSLFFFWLGFWQYQGYKLLLPPIILGWGAQEFLQWRAAIRPQAKKSASIFSRGFWRSFFAAPACRIMAVMIVFLVSLIGSYGWKLSQQSAAIRVSQKSIFSQKYLNSFSTMVDTERRLSLVSRWRDWTSNKFTLMINDRVGVWLESLDLRVLFLSGDANYNSFAVWSHGLFYLLDVGLIVAGLAMILTDQPGRPASRWLGYWLLIGCLPTLINSQNDWFFFRSSLAYLSLVLIAGYGLAWWRTHLPRFGQILLVAGYAISLANFSYHYFYRYPVYSAGGNFFYQRVLSAYLQHAQRIQPVTVYSSNPRPLFYSYLLYTNQLTSANLAKIKISTGDRDTYQLGQVTFTNDCYPDFTDFPEQQTAVLEVNKDVKCQLPELELKARIAQWQELKTTHYLSLASIADSGEIMRLYHDKVCQPELLEQYLKVGPLASFAPEKMSAPDFCQQWITNFAAME